MATLIRQLPNPDTFLCKPWSTFISAAKLHYSDKMHVFGQFPNQEDFCLVVCHVCNQVVKAQGILTHYGKNPNTYTLPTTQTHYSKNPNTLALRTTLTLTLPLQYKPP
uniref:Ataxin-7-like protein 1 n=1 Tax=Oncorhynchus mykiss TaxID=8022 RepID=A0A8C7URQ5_ONCMY